MRVVDAEELRSRLSMTAAIDALEEAFRLDDPGTAGPVRSSVDTRAGSLLLMPAAGSRGVGVKLVTLTEANPARALPFIHAVYVLFDAASQAPEAVVDGSALTALRTAAVSGLATRFLARPEARRLVLFGAGVQATAHLEAMTAVRPVEDVVVVRAIRAVPRRSPSGRELRVSRPPSEERERSLMRTWSVRAPPPGNRCSAGKSWPPGPT